MQMLGIKYVDLFPSVKNLVSAGIEHKMYCQDCPDTYIQCSMSKSGSF